MTSRAAYTGKDVKTAIKKKGFQESNGDHKRLIFYIDKKKTSIRTKISHGRKTYNGNLWNCLKEQLHLESDQLSGFIECHLSEKEYSDILKAGGFI